MANSKDTHNSGGSIELHPLPEPLDALCKQINAARRQASLYGPEHPAMEGPLLDLGAHVKSFLADHECPTLVFSDKSLIVNDRQYQVNSDCRELCWQLRARGVMAITIAGEPPTSQLMEFLAFLNTEPQEIRSNEGPSIYLRRRKVTRIVVTEAVYTTEDEEGEDQSADAPHLDSVDPAVAAALEWLSKQEDEEAPIQVPIVDILSNPDSAARLIREAVTKLHASRRDASKEEIAGEVVQDLRTLAGDDQEKWDSALPQIRKAVSKLPGDVKPSFGGISGNSTDENSRMVDVGDVEELVMDRLSHGDTLAQVDAATLQDMGGLFGAEASGQLSSWQSELEVSAILSSSARTLDTLMMWETGAVEHGRMCGALSELVKTAIENEDYERALTIAGDLAKEAERTDGLEWRRTNAKAAVNSIDVAVLHTLLARVLAGGGQDAGTITARLVRVAPRVALQAVEQLAASSDPTIVEAFRQAVKNAGSEAVEVLSSRLTIEPANIQAVILGALVYAGTAQSLGVVTDACHSSDHVLAAIALSVLGKVRSPISSQACLRALSHKASDVREAAITALGELGEPEALGHLIRFATKSSFWRDNTEERVAAVKALARLNHPDAARCLERLAKRRGLMSRKWDETVRLLAERVLEEAANRPNDLSRQAA